ncbi:MAG: HAD-IIIA family hydrolase [Desulfobacterales bacterium]|jgi:histidinol-phosphate phosphatase family protein
MKSRGEIGAVFLDRDGVINRDSQAYVKSVEEMVFVPGSLAAIGRLTRRGVPVVVVTNQSALGRGMITEATLSGIHDHLKAAVARAGGNLLDIIHCPHAPASGCHCRKPRTGMILEACRRHGFAPAASAFIGDSATDIECARNAGCGQAILVRSGLRDPTETMRRRGLFPDHTADDLSAAVSWYLKRLSE